MKILRDLFVATMLVIAIIVLRPQGVSAHASCYNVGLACMAYSNPNLETPEGEESTACWDDDGPFWWHYYGRCFDYVTGQTHFYYWCTNGMSCVP